MQHFWGGFEKRSSVAVPAGFALVGAVGGGLAAAGIPLLLRAKFEKKFKDDADKNLADHLLAKGPAIGALLGAVAGGVGGVRRYNALSMGKFGAILPSVKLKPHQVRASDQLMANDGSLLIAHATGTGKTLTGIAGFEKLKGAGKANKAIVVVPAALRENFVKNLKEFTDSSHTVFGPKGESSTKNIGDKTNSDYNIVSYELFREHGDKLLADTGADTLIMDEIHRVRGTEGTTYNKIRELRPKFKNAITLTGSVVNNEPNDVVPLLDITYTPTGHKLVSKKFFDKLFVQKDAKTYGLFSPKVEIVKGLKNKPQLAKYLQGKIDFVSHKELEKHMPDRVVETVVTPMTKEQKKLYDFSLSSVDPITRWKIRNNIPVGQKEAKDAFAKLMQARQISTDPGVMDKNLAATSPLEYSPKVKAVVDDLEKHLADDPKHKSVIYGNLLTGQLHAVEKALGEKNIPFSRFVGLGNEGVTAKTRPEEIKDFSSGKKRVLLISGAGAEGLDLKNTTMMQMLEGHFNPERIQQAEARIRRLGAENSSVLIKRYMARPEATKTQKIMGTLLRPLGLGSGGDGVDKWVYSIADRKDKLNEEFRGVLEKKADIEDVLSGYAQSIGTSLGEAGGKPLAKLVVKRRDADIEATLKQKLLDRGHEDLAQKRHYSKVMAESKLDERALDARMGVTSLVGGATLLGILHPKLNQIMTYPIKKPIAKLAPFLAKYIRSDKLNEAFGNELGQKLVASALTGVMTGLATAPLSEYAATRAVKSAIGGNSDLEVGIDRYLKKLRAKTERKYKTSKDFVHQYDTKAELGIDQISGM